MIANLKGAAVCAVLVMAMGLSCESLAQPRYAIAMHGEPALPPDFSHFPYTNPDAPQGGTLHQAIAGSFDSISPFIVKGNAAYGVKAYVFESLMARNGAEAFSLYGLLAETIDVADDGLSFTFRIRPEAKFSDGVAVLSSDVAFSLTTLRDKGLPGFKNNYSNISRIEIVDPLTITFYQNTNNRELPLLIGLMPILPEHFWKDKAFDKTTLEPIIGSGPYVIDKIKAGEKITYAKNPNYWGKNLAVNRGLWNFDVVQFDYFRDSNSTFESFKKGDTDVRIETDPVRWVSSYDFPAVREHRVILETVPQLTPAPASGFAFNTRRKIFSDPRVREALTIAFDFEWANANLFSNLYQRTYGFYSNSVLSSRGKAVDATEARLLGSAVNTLRPDMVDGSYDIPKCNGTGRDRAQLNKALQLLNEAGWLIKDTRLVNARGEPFEFNILLNGPAQEKIALHYQRTLQLLGINASVRTVESPQFLMRLRTFDFDMVPVTWYNSLSPGTEQKTYFDSGAATAQGTRNYPGVADPAIDAMIAALLQVSSQEEFEAAVRGLDRLLVAGFYIIPFYNAGGQWVARWNTIGQPDKQPLNGFEATTLWYQAP